MPAVALFVSSVVVPFLATPLLGGLITVGQVIAVGASLALQSALAPSLPGGRRGVNTPEVKGSVIQSAPAQRIIYGTQRVGGAMFFVDDSTPPFLYLGLMLSARRVTALKKYFVGEVAVDFDASRNAITTPWGDGVTTRLFRSFRDGSDTQAIDPILTADFPNLDSEFRQRGIATVVSKFDFGADQADFERLWGRVAIPNVSFIVDGAAIYDPRDPTQSVDDETSWKFSNNASLVQADWLRQPYGGRHASSRLDWDKVALAADYDDELIGLKGGGWQKRHTIDGVVSLDQTPPDVLEALLSANRGFVIQNQGKVWVTSSRPVAAVKSINDGAWASGFQYRNAQAKTELVNTVRIRFVAPDRSDEIVDGPILVNSAYVTADGETLEVTANLPLTRGHERAQRLGKGIMEESRLGRTLQGTVGLEYLGLAAGDVVTVESAIYPQIDGTYMIVGLAFADDFSAIALTLNEYDGTINARWDPATDEQDFTLPPLDVS